MLVALEQAHRERWTTTDELLKIVAERVDLLWRQYVVMHQKAGEQPPEPLEIRRPGHVEKKRGGLRSAAMRMMKG